MGEKQSIANYRRGANNQGVIVKFGGNAKNSLQTKYQVNHG
jgi:hypothetical protein